MLRVLLCVVSLGGWPRPASATTVIRAPLSQLAASSDVILHGLVRQVDDSLAVGPNGPFLTAIDIELREVLKGLDSGTATFRLLLPGGRAFGRVMKIPGMPTFRVGQEVVVLLERHARGFALTGLGQGVFTIRREGPIAIAERDLRGLELVGSVGDSGVDLPARSPELGRLLTDLRRWGAATQIEGQTP